MFKEEIFTSKEGIRLCVITYKSNIQLFLPTGYEDASKRRTLKYDKKGFESLLRYIESQANVVWKNITPKLAESIGADYDEYYDRVLDNNGYLSLGASFLTVEGPYGGENKLYQFNKKKMESFLYDVNALLDNI